MKWSRSILALFYLGVLPTRVYCQQKLSSLNNPQAQFKFCGLDTLHDSSLIDDCDAQAAQNVLTDRGYLEERTGNLRIASVLNGFPVTQLYQYTSLVNTQYIIAQASTTAYAISAGNVVAISTLATGTNLECASLSGSIICTDGSVPIWSYNGTSTGTIYGGAPVCTLLETEFGRLFCGGPSTDLSQVAISSYTGFSYWTPSTIVPLPTNSPATFEVNPNDGDSIKCMKTTPWGLFIGKRNSSYILKGYDNNTFYLQTIDPAIGCVDQRTFQMVNGLATWGSQKGVYQWNGGGPPVWISEKIDPTYRGIRQLSSNSNFWIVSQQSDWQSGSITLNGPTPSWDAVDSPGVVFPSSSIFQDNTTSAFSSGTVFTNIDTNTLTNAIQLTSTTIQDKWANQTVAGRLAWNNSAGNFSIQTPLGSGNGFYIRADGDNLNENGNVIATSSIAYSSGSWKWSSTHQQSGNDNCSYLVGNFCYEFEFYRDASTNFYAVDILDISGNNPNKTAEIIKNVSSVRTILSGQAVISSPRSGNDKFEVQRSTDGRMFLFFDSVLVASTTADNSLGASVKCQINATGGSPGGVPTNNFFTNVYYYDYNTPGTFQSRIFDTLFSTPTWGIANATFTVSSQNANGQIVFYTRTSTSPNNDMWDGYVASSDTIKFGSSQKRYAQYESIMTTFLSTQTPNVSAISFPAISTGIIYSAVHPISSSISAWKTINFTDFQFNSGELQYYVRSATNPFTTLSSTPAWAAQVNNQSVSVATGTFFQWKIDSSSITSSSQAVTLANASVDKSVTNWQEGSSGKPASGFIDQRYYLCVTLSTSDTINDGCLVFQRNRQWTLFNGPSISAMSPYNFQLIGGDGSTNSNIWQLWQDGIYDDAGTVINSSWTSKDFIVGGSLFQKTYYEIWVDNAYSPGSTLNVGWSLDKNPVFETKTINLDNNASGTNSGSNGFTAIQRVYSNSGYLNGGYLRFNFSQNLLDLPWRLNDYYFFVDVKEKQI